MGIKPRRREDGRLEPRHPIKGQTGGGFNSCLLPSPFSADVTVTPHPLPHSLTDTPPPRLLPPPPPSASILIQPTSRGHILVVKVSG